MSYDWIIAQQSIDLYDNDWNDINRKWHKIKHIHTNNGNNIKRKCTIYSDGNELCLCQFLKFGLPINPAKPTHIQHLCFTLPSHYVQTVAFPHFVVHVTDSFANDNVRKYDYGQTIIASAIKNGLNYYIKSFQQHKQLPIDSIALLKLIAKNDKQYTNIANVFYHKLQNKNNHDYNNPFAKIFSKSPTMIKRFNDLKITRNHNHYMVNKKYQSYFVDPTDDIVMKALFCDRESFDKIDFHNLINMANYDGLYEDTHTIIALNMLAENKCYDRKKIHMAMSSVAKAILISLYEQNSDVQYFGDIFFERIVCLYWAGFGDHINKQWIVNIAKHQSKIYYGWSHDYKQHGKHWIPIQQVSTPHPTGLALLAMIYYEIGESKQSFYPINTLYN